DPGGPDTETLIGREDIVVVEPKSLKETMDLITALETTDRGRFDWVSVDSITFMMDRFGGAEVYKAYQEGKDVRRPYGKLGASANQVISRLVHLEDQNVLFVAHLVNKENDQDTVVDQELGESVVKLAVPPSVWKLLGPAVGFIGRTFRRTEYVKDSQNKRNKVTNYYVSFNDGERSPAGSRYTMDGEYLSGTSLLADLAKAIIKEKK
ncbi:MAG: AAA family ATPase, partial [Deltaproteobacteria bacterium]|nr:AAA family ATPase [Deltaproteobacteria bacterium]